MLQYLTKLLSVMFCEFNGCVKFAVSEGMSEEARVSVRWLRWTYQYPGS
jgi:hypothetical protein